MATPTDTTTTVLHRVQVWWAYESGWACCTQVGTLLLISDHTGTELCPAQQPTPTTLGFGTFSNPDPAVVAAKLHALGGCVLRSADEPDEEGACWATVAINRPLTPLMIERCDPDLAPAGT